MLTTHRNARSITRLGVLCSAAAMVLSACGGSTGLGDGPTMLNENLPSSVTVGAAQPGAPEPGSIEAMYAVRSSQETDAATQSSPTAAPEPSASDLPPYGAAAASADDTVQQAVPASTDANGALPAEASGAMQYGATTAVTPGQQAPMQQAPMQQIPMQQARMP